MRARRRRRRRAIGTLLFVIVAVVIVVVAVLALSGGDDASDEAATTTAAAATTTTAPPFAGSYKVTTGVNVRQGPGTTFPTAGTIETGHSVLVVCVAQGQPVEGPNGPDPQWLKITGIGPTGYVTSIYVATGDDLRNGKIPACPAA
jgi:uncharacterized protein YraI